MRRWLSFMLLILLAACQASPENHYYTLSAMPVEVAQSTSISVYKLSLPAVTDRPQIALYSRPNEVEIREYQRWAEPFDAMARRVLTQDLGRVATNKPLKRTDVVIQQFSGDTQGNVSLKAVWVTTPGQARHYFEKLEKADDGSIDAMAAAMSHLLGELAHAMNSAQ